jgi:SOS-response transcriptional repressor LexA
MEPLYHDGDALLVQRKAEVEQGEIGVFIIDGCGYIKKLGHNELISVNPEYNNITLTSDNAAVCFGKAVGLAQFPK